MKKNSSAIKKKRKQERTHAKQVKNSQHIMLTDEVTGSIAVGPKSDMDAEVLEADASNEQENENEAAAKTTREVDDELSKKDVETRRLIEERRNTFKGEKQRLKDLSKQLRTCIRDKTRTKRTETFK